MCSRATWADDEILAEAKLWSEAATASLQLVSADLNLLIKAQRRGIDVLQLEVDASKA